MHTRFYALATDASGPPLSSWPCCSWPAPSASSGLELGLAEPPALSSPIIPTRSSCSCHRCVHFAHGYWNPGFFNYGSLYLYLVGVAGRAARLCAGRRTCRLSTISGRPITALLGVGSVALLYFALRREGRRLALLSALLLALFRPARGQQPLCDRGRARHLLARACLRLRPPRRAMRPSC